MKDRSNLLKILIIFVFLVFIGGLLILLPLFFSRVKDVKTAVPAVNVVPTRIASPAETTLTGSETTKTSEATETIESTSTGSSEPQALPVFDHRKALAHIEHLASKIGPRREGTAQEKAAAEYIKAEFSRMGYQPIIQTFPLPDGATSQNIIAFKAGTLPGNRVVIGAHYDTKLPSPGADDNASGVGVVLALAEAVRNYPLKPTVCFIAFGAEEMIDSNPDHHHYGSRHYVNTLPAQELSEIAGMVSVDMVGYGKTFYVGSLGLESRVVADAAITEAAALGQKTFYFKSKEWSDHEPFEKKGIPTAWLEWKENPYYHKASDTFDKIKPVNIDMTGRVLLNLLLHLDDSKLVEWKK